MILYSTVLYCIYCTCMQLCILELSQYINSHTHSHIYLLCNHPTGVCVCVQLGFISRVRLYAGPRGVHDGACMHASRCMRGVFGLK